MTLFYIIETLEPHPRLSKGEEPRQDPIGQNLFRNIENIIMDTDQPTFLISSN